MFCANMMRLAAFYNQTEDGTSCNDRHDLLQIQKSLGPPFNGSNHKSLQIYIPLAVSAPLTKNTQTKKGPKKNQKNHPNPKREGWRNNKQFFQRRYMLTLTSHRASFKCVRTYYTEHVDGQLGLNHTRNCSNVVLHVSRRLCWTCHV